MERHEQRARRVQFEIAQRDLAAGPVILEALRRDTLTEQYKVWVMQAMSALCGNTWNYSMHEWGPARSGNQTAIEEFETWTGEQAPAAMGAHPVGHQVPDVAELARKAKRGG